MSFHDSVLEALTLTGIDSRRRFPGPLCCPACCRCAVSRWVVRLWATTPWRPAIHIAGTWRPGLGSLGEGFWSKDGRDREGQGCEQETLDGQPPWRAVARAAPPRAVQSVFVGAIDNAPAGRPVPWKVTGTESAEIGQAAKNLTASASK